MNLQVLLLLVIFPLAFCQAQNVVHITPDKDNTLIGIPSSLDTNSNGSGPHIFAGRVGASTGYERRAILHFDVAGNLPQNAQIDSVQLQLHMSQAPNINAEVFSIKRLTADWGEGGSIASGGVGVQAQSGDATWVHTFYNNQFWTQAGGDFDTTALQQFTISDTGTYQIFGNTNLVNLIESWYDSAATNFGLILIGNESAPSTTKRFGSRENPVVAFRPQLQIWYHTVSNVRQTSLNQSFKLFPNPTNQTLTVNTQNKTIEKIQITDVLGRPLHLKILKQDTSWTIDTSPLIPGNYFIQIFTPNSFTTQTFIKQ